MKSSVIAPLLLVVAILAAGPARAEESLARSGRPGVMQPFLYQAARHPVASVILFVGGDGVLEQMSTSFLMRVRKHFLTAGMSVAVPDTPSDHPGGFGPLFRAWGEHVDDMAAIVAFLKSRADVPIWAIGTSNGTISAANVAEQLGPRSIAGAILTSSVWLGGLKAVPIRKISVPVLLVHDRSDACPASPFALAEESVPYFRASPEPEFIAVAGPAGIGPPCGPDSAHDFYKVENRAVAAIIAWIKARQTPAM